MSIKCVKFGLTISAIIIAILLVAFNISTEQTPITACHNTVTQHMGVQVIQVSCTATSQQSWSAWFSGNSRSTQFHFVDFLELLNRFGVAK